MNCVAVTSPPHPSSVTVSTYFNSHHLRHWLRFHYDSSAIYFCQNEDPHPKQQTLGKKKKCGNSFLCCFTRRRSSLEGNFSMRWYPNLTQKTCFTQILSSHLCSRSTKLWTENIDFRVLNQYTFSLISISYHYWLLLVIHRFPRQQPPLFSQIRPHLLLGMSALVCN